MKPYYDDGKGITIWHGDCREIIPFMPKPDLVLTDPPYGIANIWKGGGGGSKSWSFKASETHGWDAAICDSVLELPMFGDCIIWGGNYYPLPPMRGWLVWDKKVNDDFTTGQCELAWTNLNIPIKTFRFAQCEQASEGPKFHPTQKPLRLMTWCMKWSKGEIVLDPFMGSGTTLRAAKDLGRRAIGIEKEEKYCEIAARRLSQEVFAL